MSIKYLKNLNTKEVKNTKKLKKKIWTSATKKKYQKKYFTKNEKKLLIIQIKEKKL